MEKFGYLISYRAGSVSSRLHSSSLHIFQSFSLSLFSPHPSRTYRHSCYEAPSTSFPRGAIVLFKIYILFRYGVTLLGKKRFVACDLVRNTYIIQPILLHATHLDAGFKNTYCMRNSAFISISRFPCLSMKSHGRLPLSQNATEVRNPLKKFSMQIGGR